MTAESSVPGAVGERPPRSPTWGECSYCGNRWMVGMEGTPDGWPCGHGPESEKKPRGAVGEREELDVERLREAHRLAQVMDGDYMVNVATVYARLSVNEGGPGAGEREEPLDVQYAIHRIIDVLDNDEGGAELYEAALALRAARLSGESE